MNSTNDRYFLRILIFFVIAIVLGLIFRHFYYAPIINSDKLLLITPLSDYQAYHPKAVAFDNEWNGYKYWIAFTPYPYGSALEENPVVNVSNDLIHWSIPKGLVNPLDIPDDVSSLKYNSDTHLLYNNDLNRLEIFWRYVNDEKHQVTIFMSYSYDGVNWSEKSIFLYSDDRSERDYVSPAIIYDSGTYKVWYVDKRKVNYLEVINGKQSESNVVELKYDKSGLYTWHIDVDYNNDKGVYEILTVAYFDVNNREDMKLYYAKSNDGYSFKSVTEVLSPSTDSSNWDSQGLYRSSLLYKDNKYYVFYSGHDDEMNVGVGLMCGENIKRLKSCTGGEV